jgi:hypothetical protein
MTKNIKIIIDGKASLQRVTKGFLLKKLMLDDKATTFLVILSPDYLAGVIL